MSEEAVWGAVRRAQPMQEFRKVMREKKITSAELAKRMKVSPPYISKLLSGRDNVTVDQLHLVADALEVGLSISVVEAVKVFHNDGQEPDWQAYAEAEAALPAKADSPEVAEGSVVQLDPELTKNPMFRGCMMLVTEVYPWGVQGFVQALGWDDEMGGQAYYRAETGTFALVGFAQWVPA